jgi:hypothetical protein
LLIFSNLNQIHYLSNSYIVFVKSKKKVIFFFTKKDSLLQAHKTKPSKYLKK